MHSRPINPPVPRYTIPAGSSVWLSRQLDLEHRWKVHHTRRRLDFDEVFCFHGPELMIFLVQDWVLAIAADQTIRRPCRIIDALLFDIQYGDSSNSQLIAWPDAYGRSQFLRPKRRRDTLLDLRAGQEILHRSEQGEQELVVSRVRLYRTNRSRENGQVVACGRSWLASR